MLIDIPSGRGRQTLEIDEGRLRACLVPAHAPAEKDEAAIIGDALMHPVASPRLKDIAAGKRKITLITSDHTRPLPSALTLPPYIAEIRKGSPSAEITVLVATGLHRKPTPDEMKAKFGDLLSSGLRFVIHDADDEANLAYLGLLPSGGELWLNRLVTEADLVISEGFVEPHFFAGFSGGRKSVLPGVAGRKTVLYNHNAGFIASDMARQGVLRGNPIHIDMEYAAGKAGLRFILNVLLDIDKRVIAAYAGDPVKAHAKAAEKCLEATRVPAVPADIVVTSNGGYPLDQNIYQCVKGLTAAERCVREGGVIIMCASLGDGSGGDAFYHWFKDRKDARQVLDDIAGIPAGDTRPDQWQAQILARVMLKARCIFVSDEANRQTLNDMHLGWAPDVNAALNEAYGIAGRGASVTVIPDGVGVIVQ